MVGKVVRWDRRECEMREERKTRRKVLDQSRMNFEQASLPQSEKNGISDFFLRDPIFAQNQSPFV